jgi:DNA-binding PadR family transcriptional regulator
VNRAIPPATADPRGYLPLTPAEFHVLLALAGGERHGYAILQDIEQRSPELRLRTGTLYTVLKRMLDADWIRDSPAPKGDDPRRRYYRLTSLGNAVVKAEARRLESLVALARARRVLARGPALTPEKGR